MISWRTPLAALTISSRTLNYLDRDGLADLEGLASCTPAELLRIHGFGLNMLAEVETALGEYGLELGTSLDRLRAGRIDERR